MPTQDQSRLGKYYAMAQVGMEMVVPIFVGWWADEKLGSRPWLLVLGVILGFGLGLWHLIALSHADSRDDDSQQQ